MYSESTSFPYFPIETENRPVTASRAVFCFLRVRLAAFAPPGRFNAFAGRFVPKIVQNGQIVVH